MPTLTDQQRAVVDAFACSDLQSVNAGAGTGKTTVLRACVKSQPHLRGLYITYSSDLAQSARSDFAGDGTLGKNIDVKTAHALAWKHTAEPFRQRVKTFVPYQRVAKHMGLKTIETEHGVFYTSDLMRLIHDGVKMRRLGVGSTRQVLCEHGLEEHLDRLLYVADAWNEDLDNPKGVFPYTHDDYLVSFVRTGMDLGYDYLMLDEAQDADRAIATFFERQDCPKISVGDKYQTIYAWRGTVSMFNDDCACLDLTYSWRFGPEIASVANTVLSRLGDMRLSGCASQSSITNHGNIDRGAVLCRTNEQVVSEALECSRSYRSFHIVDKNGETTSSIMDVFRLRAGKRPKSVLMRHIKSYEDLEKIVETDNERICTAYRIARRYGEHAISKLIANQCPPEQAEVIFSTAHRAKGKEFDHVLLGKDFRTPIDEMSEEELMLLYVAVSRAKKSLDLGNAKCF
ncbi:UvrD-helicase domain-containing protein [Actinomyces vulturis]|uniref:UvrD-helicase domain-containing protein n=1 Tax=Actinomyces vulturis TaxID=1857645 RepID=UPI0008340D65|nr:UvrD-helicase domain-containing protein [Actinomyces vulturis]